MKVKTSITLSEDLVAELDRLCGEEPRSAFIERVLRSYVREQVRREIGARDRALIDAAADRLNQEVEDVLRYQVWPEE
jgi:metal-responsive CopG/Arc/MetJ family transcriptional regulator